MTRSTLHEQINVAVLDDDVFFCRLVSSIVSKNPGFAVREASTGHELQDVLDDGHTDCIILDYDLGAESGFAVQQRLQERFVTLPPVIMVTGDERQGTVIKALRLGVRDFMPKKGLNAEALVSSIKSAIERDRAERRVKYDLDRLSGTAVRDPLTGLATKAALDARLSQTSPADRTGSNSKPHDLIAIEIRELPLILGTFGPSISAQVIKAFATRLRSVLRTTDLCGRYVKDVFLLIVDLQADPANMDKLCKRLSDTLSFRLDLDSIGIDLSARIRSVESVEAIVGDEQQDSSHHEKQDAGFEQAETSKISDRAEPSRTVNRRREARQRVFKRGQIVLPGLAATIDCTVRNVSANGAGLRLDVPFAAPAEFELNIVGADARRHVRVRWQTGPDLGVEYID